MGFSPGEFVGDYEVLGLLGTGGFGEVYRVRNVISDRQEAMKIVLSDASRHAQLAERFIREIKLHARLHHPNITSLHSAVKFQDQILMIMEYVEGVSVMEMIKGGPIDSGRAVNIICQVLAALDYSHRHRVLHRDVKPENIIVDPHGVAKLTDFGIAKSDASENLTETGGLVGSFSYMSPEQIRSLTPDERSDVYLVGVTLYEMVTGVLPYDGPSEWAIMRAHLEAVPKPPDQVNPNVSAELSAVILKAMARKPEDRFQSANEFRLSLEAATGRLESAVLVHAAPADAADAPAAPAPPVLPRKTGSLAKPTSAGHRQPSAAEAAPSASPSTHRAPARRLWIGGAVAAVVILAAAVAYLRSRPASPAPSRCCRSPTSAATPALNT